MAPDAEDQDARAAVTVAFDAGEIAALDAWIAVQDIAFTRGEAIRAIVSATLQLMQGRD